MSKRGKKYLEKVKDLDLQKRYSPVQAIKLVKEMKYVDFDESVELHFNLGINPRHADQQLRGMLVLPHGTGKKIRIAVVTEGEKLLESKDAGADEVGGEDLIEKIKGGWFDFDLLLASPNVMSKLGKLGKLLGSKGLMPNPKSGTVTQDLGKAIKDFKAGKIEYRNDKTGIIHVIFGKVSFSEEQLLENFETIFDILLKAKPTKSKGVYMKSISVSSSMGPGVFVEPLKIRWKDIEQNG
jgi:large subunit ribosomal protein L1